MVLVAPLVLVLIGVVLAWGFAAWDWSQLWYGQTASERWAWNRRYHPDRLVGK